MIASCIKEDLFDSSCHFGLSHATVGDWVGVWFVFVNFCVFCLAIYKMLYWGYHTIFLPRRFVYCTPAMRICFDPCTLPFCFENSNGYKRKNKPQTAILCEKILWQQQCEWGREKCFCLDIFLLLILLYAIVHILFTRQKGKSQDEHLLVLITH